MLDCERLTKKIKRSGIYCIYNTSNKRFYIGSANSLWRRFIEHRRHLRNNTHTNTFLQADWNKCGEEVYIFFILEECNESVRLTFEQIWLNYLYDNKKQCYNIENIAGSRVNWKPTDETKKKMSESAKKRVRQPWSDDVKKKISESNKGKICSEKTKEKLRRDRQKIYDVKLVSPSGMIYGPIINLREFCRKNELDRASVLRLIKGKQKRVGQWRLE